MKIPKQILGKQTSEILNGLNKRNLFVLIESGEKNN